MSRRLIVLRWFGGVLLLHLLVKRHSHLVDKFVQGTVYFSGPLMDTACALRAQVPSRG